MNFPITYIMHYSKLIERKKHLDECLKDIPRKPVIVTEFDQEDLTEEIIRKNYIVDIRKYKEVVSYGYGGNKGLRLCDISLNLKHFESMKNFIKTNEKMALFLEDDIIPNPNYIEEIKFALSNTPSDYDMIFIGAGGGEKLRREKIKNCKKINDNCYEMPSTNCTESYIISRNAAIKIIENFSPFSLAIDWELGYRIMQLNLKIYWWFPCIFQQGSLTGKFKTSLISI